MRLFPLNSLSGRVFAILFLGIAITALLGLYLVEGQRVRDIRELQRVRTADKLAGTLPEFIDVPASDRPTAIHKASGMMLDAGPDAEVGTPAPDLDLLLAQQLPEGIGAQAYSVPVATCEQADRQWHQALGDARREDRPELLTRTDCWRIEVAAETGTRFDLYIVTPPLFLRETTVTSPIFLITVLLAALLLAFVVTQLALAPVRRLTRAAHAIDPASPQPAVPETGPVDVRAAIEAFNAMRTRLSDYHAEQTTLLAAIAHDLQTPLTRLRLKLDKVPDEDARASLLKDWQAMRAIVSEGLALARAGHDTEAEAVLNVDSMLNSIAEDEQERGHDVSFTKGAGVDCTCRPQMLRRAVQNLIDNAVLYGKAARIATVRDGNALEIRIEDKGPGIPEDQLARVFEPMVRLDAHHFVGGIGLGLTSAKTLVQRCGGTIRLENMAKGGLRAVITLQG